MILNELKARLTNTTLLMEPTRARAWLEMLTDAAANEMEAGLSFNLDAFSEDGEFAPYEIVGDTAIIPVTGALLHRFPYSTSFATGYDNIRDRLDHAQSNESVSKILLDIDSPGGTVAGFFDMVDYVASIKKPTTAHANEMAASAAYGIASACDKVFVSRTSDVGSVGVIRTHFDISAALEKFGEKVTFIQFGEHKSAGSPYQPLSDEILAIWQEEVDDLGQQFASMVANGRSMSNEAVIDTQALTYSGEAAVEVGFADGVIGFDDLVTKLTSKSATDRTIGANPMSKFTQEELDAAVAEAVANKEAEAEASIQSRIDAGIEEGVSQRLTADQQRVESIMSLEEADGKKTLATSLAESGVSVDQAKAILAAAPTEGSLQLGEGAGANEEEEPGDQAGSFVPTGRLIHHNTLRLVK